MAIHGTHRHSRNGPYLEPPYEELRFPARLDFQCQATSGVFAKTTRKIPQKSSKSRRMLSSGVVTFMIRKEPISERVAARKRAFARPNGGFTMPRLRLDRLIALTPLVLLLDSTRCPRGSDGCNCRRRQARAECGDCGVAAECVWPCSRSVRYRNRGS